MRNLDKEKEDVEFPADHIQVEFPENVDFP
jgi:hypothetical protein